MLIRTICSLFLFTFSGALGASFNGFREFQDTLLSSGGSSGDDNLVNNAPSKADEDYAKQILLANMEGKESEALHYKEDMATFLQTAMLEEITKGSMTRGLGSDVSDKTVKFWESGLSFFRDMVNGKNDENSDKDDETSWTDKLKDYVGEFFDSGNMSWESINGYIRDYVEENVSFWLFTTSPDEYEIITSGPNSNISQSKFDKNKPTKILIHGWINSAENFYSRTMIEAYISTGKYNVISVDWSKLSYSFYTLSRTSVNFVGPYVATLIDHLVNKEGAKLDDIHILGHSLGAHVAGIAGQYVRSGKVSRITGFDPARPLFGDDDNYRLDISDGRFVDVIHSSALGLQEPLGHADFYPNDGGPLQPGCGINVAVCPHRRAYEFYVESLKEHPHQFLSYPCHSWDAFKNLKCNSNPVVMGEFVNRQARGQFYLRTSEESPFALGVKSLSPK